MPLDKNEYISDVWRDGLFKNKVVFCTGGAGSICSAQVRAMIYLGANACIVGRNPTKTPEVAKDMESCRKGAKVLGIGGVDVRNPKSLEEAVERCVKELGGIDFVIAGAAGNFLAPINQLSPNAFKSVIEIDLIGSFNTMKLTLPYLRESAAKHRTDGKLPSPNGTGGRIIFVSATLHYAGTPLQLHASAAKAGIDSMSASVCIEEGPRGVTSNVIAPGAILGTEGMSRLAPPGEGGDSIYRGVPTGRGGHVKEIADATVYLFSDTGNYVNGAELVVDGGGWRTKITPGNFRYPDFLLGDEEVQGVKGMKSKM